MSAKQVIVVGGNFGGLAAALELKYELADDVAVTVVSASARFLFNPSLIWLPFGKRRAGDITFPLEPTFDAHGVEFVHAEATAIDPAARTVTTSTGAEYRYDYLILATGYRNDYEAVPGLGPDGCAQSITTLADAERAGAAWRDFLDDPGPVVIGATQGASCFGAAYEFLFNMSHQLRKSKLNELTSLTFLTAEPFVGHFGIGGLPGGEKLLKMFLKKEGIAVRTGVAFEEVGGDYVRLTDGSKVKFAYSMVVPPFVGQDVVRAVPNLTDGKGYIPVEDTYRSKAYPEIYAAGIAAQVPVPWRTSVPIGIPKTGFPTESMAKVAARNVASAIKGEDPVSHKEFGEMAAVCMMDAGNNGVLILADHMLPPRKAAVMIPGPQVHAMKLAFEKYYLWKSRHGYVRLP
ncbi:FAD-dependent oxidoreductase [Actinospica sp. MGRD01-02]|uniref:FAD-dependent oxidoreductase n=1 Tax=Actinospica acidithermotolerans TaxID=2828514 RepID=A0A941ECK1_9ACTN|nr:FAD-dependent oxidoreductase [Actinospica acidithermotolerans]MBR7828797.1 FAD-dependent oxidoreductase [Actinospica acidithermotolerans]